MRDDQGTAEGVRPLEPGDPATAGPYRLLGRLGDGGQGTVFLGRDAGGARAAVKLLHPHLIGDTDARERFLHEVRLAASVARFCTAQVLGTGLAGERPYIAGEYVPGAPLDASVRREGPRSGGALDRLAINTATALAAIHRAGVQHRDFKPANVLLGPDGPVVIDFGIARALDQGRTDAGPAWITGTPGYMAPEQTVPGGHVGTPADVFAWGCCMVFAATGRGPFPGGSVPEVFQRIVSAEPDLGDLRPPLRGLVAECLAKDPALRPTAEQVLSRLTGSGPVPPAIPYAAAPAPAPPPVPVAPTVRRRRRGVLAGAGAAVAVLVAAVGAFAVLGGEDAGPAPAAATSPAAAPPPSPVAGALTAGPVPTGPDLLRNGGFEKAVPAPWDAKRAVLVPSGRPGGARAVRIRALPGQDAAVQQRVTGLRPRTTYLLAGWVRTDGGATFIGAKDYGDGPGVYRPTPDAATGYTRLAGAFTTGPRATSAVVFCWREKPGTGYCDDLTLHAVR
ncbi:protein kinase domain-containing protein [Spirillospora sp. CA-253888]